MLDVCGDRKTQIQRAVYLVGTTISGVRGLLGNIAALGALEPSMCEPDIRGAGLHGLDHRDWTALGVLPYRQISICTPCLEYQDLRGSSRKCHGLPLCLPSIFSAQYLIIDA